MHIIGKDIPESKDKYIQEEYALEEVGINRRVCHINTEP